MLHRFFGYFRDAIRIKNDPSFVSSGSRVKFWLIVFVAALLVSRIGTAQQSTIRLSGRAMSTTYEVVFARANVDSSTLHVEVDSLLNSLTTVFSTYDPESTLAQINASRDTTSIHQVGDDFAALFLRAREIYRESGNAFNPAIGPLTLAWGIASEAGSVPDDERLSRLLSASEMNHFRLSGNGSLSDKRMPPRKKAWTLRKSDPEAALDFNGIAKGYAVDKLSELLILRGAERFLVELGGEIRTRGTHPADRDWQIAIEYPAATVSKSQTVLSIGGMSLATSGNYRSERYLQGHKIVHTVEPQSGLPETNDLLSVTVLASDCSTADAYATALMVMGSEKAIRFLSSHPFLNAYLMIGQAENSFDVYFTPGLNKYLLDEK